MTVRVGGGVNSEAARSLLDAHLLAVKRGGLLYFDVSCLFLINSTQTKPFARIGQVISLMKARPRLKWVGTPSRTHGIDPPTNNANFLCDINQKSWDLEPVKNPESFSGELSKDQFLIFLYERGYILLKLLTIAHKCSK